MAKQIAHEIKNPLTPMKLSVQHLRRVVSLKGTDEEHLKQFEDKMIGQIELSPRSQMNFQISLNCLKQR